MARVTRKFKHINFKKIVDSLTQQQQDFAENVIKQQMEEIVAPFEHEIDFIVTKENVGGTVRVIVNPSEDAAGLNRAGDVISGASLWKWLNEGTDTRWVGMPDGFSNETFVNSLSTSHADYERDDIYFRDNAAPGITAREWTKLLKENNKDEYIRVMKTALAKAIK